MSKIGATDRVDSNISIFLSSTFVDMHRERDVLSRLVFPRLRAELRSIGVAPFELDLRWGITELMARDGGAATLCLEYLSGCVPFVLGIVGERVGWRPPIAAIDRLDRAFASTLHDGMGMTEIELRYAVRLSKAASSGPLPVFLRFDLSVGESSNDSLREWLMSETGVVTIPYDTADSFESLVFEELGTLISREHSKPSVRSTPRTFSAATLPRSGQLRRIGWAARGRHPLVLASSPGVGTSWLLRRWTRERGNALYVDARRASPDAMRVISDQLSWSKVSVRDGPSRLIRALCDRLADPADVKIVVIDHFESLFSSIDRADLSVLPARLERGTTLVCSISSERLARQAIELGWRVREIPRISIKEGVAHARAYLARYGKVLTPSQRDLVELAPWTTNFGALTLVLEELRRFGKMEKLDERLDTLARCVDDGQIVDEVVNGLQGAFPACWSTAVSDAIMLLAHSLRGLNDEVLAAAVGRAAGREDALPSHLLGAIRLSLGKTLVDRSDVLDIDSSAVLNWADVRSVDSASDFHRTLDALERTLLSVETETRSPEAPRIAYARGGSTGLVALLSEPTEALHTLNVGETFLDGWLARLRPGEREAVASSWCKAARTGDVDAAQAWRLGEAAGRMGERERAEYLLSRSPGDESIVPEALDRRQLLLARLRRDSEELSAIAQRCLNGDGRDAYHLVALLIILDAIADGHLSVQTDEESRLCQVTRTALAESTDSVFRGQALLLLGQLDLMNARFAAASTEFDRAEQHARRTGSGELLCQSLERSSAVALEMHRFRKARSRSAECREIARRLGLATFEALAFERAIETETRRANWPEAYALAAMYLERAGTGALDVGRARQVFDQLERN